MNRQKSNADIMDLKGAWKDISERVFRKMKQKWSRWSRKDIARY